MGDADVYHYPGSHRSRRQSRMPHMRSPGMAADGPHRAAHHHKVVSIDDTIAFVGGIYINIGRWDTRKRAYNDPLRKLPDDSSYGESEVLETEVFYKRALRSAKRSLICIGHCHENITGLRQFAFSVMNAKETEVSLKKTR